MATRRIAVLSDIHGNLTALEAVISDIRDQSPDVVYHLGDLAASGYRPAEVLDRIQDLGWKGVLGNTDEMLWRPELLRDLANRAPRLRPLLKVLFEEIAPCTARLIGSRRLAWLKELPPLQRDGDMTLIHASPADLWRAPLPNATDEDLQLAFSSLASRIVLYGHVHHPFIRAIDCCTVANVGSVSISYDGDPRASYALIDDRKIQIRRIEYDIEGEIRGLIQSGFPRALWLASVMKAGTYRPPD